MGRCTDISRRSKTKERPTEPKTGIPEDLDTMPERVKLMVAFVSQVEFSRQLVESWRQYLPPAEQDNADRYLTMCREFLGKVADRI